MTCAVFTATSGGARAEVLGVNGLSPNRGCIGTMAFKGSSGSSSTSNHFAKRMGEASSFISSDNSKSVDRMDLGSSADRLSAQVKAISVLNTVRAMQDEIKDINQQIEKENSMFLHYHYNSNTYIKG